MKKPISSVWTYSILVLAATVLLNFTHQPILVALGQATPLLTACLILVFLHKKRWSTLKSIGLFRFGSVKWHIYGVLAGLPVMLSFLAAWILGYVELPSIKEFPDWMNSQGDRFLLLVKHYFSLHTLTMLFLFSFAEEFGWRGFLHTHLHEVASVKKTLLITGAIWILFHYPFYMNDYSSNGHTAVNMLLFTLTLIPLSIIMGWIRLKSQSLWPVVIFHMSINFHRGFWEQVFYTKASHWETIAGESGVISLIVWALIAAPIWRSLDRSEHFKHENHKSTYNGSP
ncbi:CPBP family intramembrane glutamic endopeptidase [Ectobacillus panaciterrae]|uniref:CPBP family intramembrane glutamic endopeptidase n=1 Tax=Ectobacillus panaciterrae TaxID=363872 RepID=UPI0004159AC9|nr:type II CAAX endopeptidase family protein [Ectobacillus panaciterrae]